MRFKSFLSNWRNQLLFQYSFLKLFLKSCYIKPSSKQVYIDISGLRVNRYLYCFLKLFALNGYTVFLPREKELMSELDKGKTGEALFKRWMLKEGWLKFGKPTKSSALSFSSDQLSNDYYSAFFYNEFSNAHYHVPMCKYPARYKSRWVKNIKRSGDRKNSIFMIGNIDEDQYAQLGSSRFFNIISRSSLYQFLKFHSAFLDVNSFPELANFIEGDDNNKIVIIDTSEKFQIPGTDLDNVLNEFRFILALPGIIVPNAHNLTEGMAVGCIPLIQREYAQFLRPPLEDGENAIFFEDLKDLQKKIMKLLELDDKEVDRLQKNVLLYYNLYLSPGAIVNKLEKMKFKKIFLQGEWVSLQQYERNKV